ncbi:MAG TPA: efflux RND transporter permease subunit, partial [Vicinamibacterales bacterium]|nr:efflux RND transporter permease subunit [Vicinamibacterales bacterium]
MATIIEWLIATSIKHRLVVVAATLLLAAAGIWAFATLTTDAFPDLTPNQVIVMTTATGLSPVEAEQEL